MPLGATADLDPGDPGQALAQLPPKPDRHVLERGDRQAFNVVQILMIETAPDGVHRFRHNIQVVRPSVGWIHRSGEDHPYLKRMTVQPLKRSCPMSRLKSKFLKRLHRNPAAQMFARYQ